MSQPPIAPSGVGEVYISALRILAETLDATVHVGQAKMLKGGRETHLDWRSSI